MGLISGDPSTWSRLCSCWLLAGSGRGASGIERREPLARLQRLCQHDILRLQVSVNDLQLPVDVVHGYEHVLCDVLHEWQGYAPVVVSPYKRQQVVSQHLQSSGLVVLHFQYCRQIVQDIAMMLQESVAHNSLNRKAHLKDHADVSAMRPSVFKPVTQPHAVPAVLWIPLLDLCQECDLITCSFTVV